MTIKQLNQLTIGTSFRLDLGSICHDVVSHLKNGQTAICKNFPTMWSIDIIPSTTMVEIMED